MWRAREPDAQATTTHWAMRADAKDLIVGLDIGTSKVVAAVAELLPDGRFQVIGLGQARSEGLRRGVVVNIEATVQSIRRALEEAELMAACRIADVFTGIAGSHIRSFNSSGMVAIKDREVSTNDVDPRDRNRARAAHPDRSAGAARVDAGIHRRWPGGHPGTDRHERRAPGSARAHRHGAVSAAQNIIKCVRRCGLEVQDLILQPLASSLSVLTNDERNSGSR